MLDVKDLKVAFPVRQSGEKAVLMAVNGVDIRLEKGDALGLVGESGSGKSTVGKTILRLNKNSSGRIVFDGQEISRMTAKEEMRYRQRAQMIFQDPHSALNPRMTIFRSVSEPLILQTKIRGGALKQKVQELLEIVGLQRQFLYRYPHELSGGQKQRVCIARAIALNPELLVLDEPTSALDVSVQAQILEFLKSIQTELDLTFLFISHNLAVVRHVCNKVAVMYLGQIVEQGDTEDVFSNPQHPYTKALLAAVPLPEINQKRRSEPLHGDIPSPLNLPTGCFFGSRCREKIVGLCDQASIINTELPSQHLVRCIKVARARELSETQAEMPVPLKAE
ncbi:ABC transporter ATP-binding protein [Sneathiella aquimaris]|uniref:ABC transporter ATP-binding protein n=1 Tax=Sneathiella aquimaris TaxID=2599305 RepID=UPI00146BFF23|nr:ABC transporter ATP-binding protein [Sneathiella aquimaris]